MQITVKLIKLGDSRAIIIPAIWLKEKERELGQPIAEVTVNLNGDVEITVKDKQED